MKRILSFLLSIALIFTEVPFTGAFQSFAAESVLFSEENTDIVAAEAFEAEDGAAFEEEPAVEWLPGQEPAEIRDEQEEPAPAEVINEDRIVRRPEQFYDQIPDEQEGVLVAYDSKSRTYLLERNTGVDRSGRSLNTYMTVIGGYDGNYVDEEGRLRPIDDTLVITETEQRIPVNTPSDYVRMLGASGNDGAEKAKKLTNVNGEASASVYVGTGDAGYEISNGERSVRVIPEEGNYNASSVSGNAVRFSDVFKDVDVQYTILNGSVKEDIILLEKQNRNEFRYKLEGKGIVITSNGVNTVTASDSLTGEEIIRITAPYMTDAKGSISFNVKVGYDELNGIMTLAADRDWLEDPERAYPVRIDPDSKYVGNDAITLKTVAKGDNKDAVIHGVEYEPYWFNNEFGANNPNRTGYFPDWGNCKTLVKINYDFTKLKSSGLIGSENIKNVVFAVTPRTEDGINNTPYMLREILKDWNVSGTTYATAQAQGLFTEAGSRQIAGPAQTQGNSGGTAYKEMAFSLGKADQSGKSPIEAWISGERLCRGLLMEAQIEYHPADTTHTPFPADEFFAGTLGTEHGPVIKLLYEGADIDPGQLLIYDVTQSTVSFEAGITESNAGGRTVEGVVLHGITQAGAKVNWSVAPSGDSGTVTAGEDFIYPDLDEISSDCFATDEEGSNWQSNAVMVSDLQLNKKYHGEMEASGYIFEEIEEEGEGTEEGGEEKKEYEVVVEVDGTSYGAVDEAEGSAETEDDFLLYKVKAADVLTRIAKHYGTTIQQLQKDNHIDEQLAYQGDILLIRNPSTTEPYSIETGDSNFDDILMFELNGYDGYRCLYDMEPVNMSTGSFYLEHADAEMEELGGTFAITRSYNSSVPNIRGEFGMGWSSSFGEKIMVLEDGRILYIKSDGQGLSFTRTGEKTWVGPEGYEYSLFAVSDLSDDSFETTERTAPYSSTKVPASKGWKLTCTDGTVRMFNAYGLMVKKTDRKGLSYIFTYDSNYSLTGIDTPSGKHFDVEQDSKGVTKKITLPDGNTVTYVYSAGYDLLSVTDAIGTIRYEYDSDHHMTAWYDRNGTRVTRNVYDGSGRVTAQTDANGNTATLTYETESDGSVITTLTDNAGNEIAYTSDSEGRSISKAYADGATEEKTWTDGFVTEEKALDGAVTKYTHDENGNVLSEERADGEKILYEYNDLNLPVSVTDYEGNETTYTYDTVGNLTGTCDPEGGETLITYDEYSRPVTVTDANGGISTFAYEGLSPVPASLTDPLDNTTLYAYDTMYRLTKTTDPLEGVTETAYDALGRVTKETAPDGGTTQYTYDAAGYVKMIKDALNAETTFTYDGMGNILSGKDAKGNTLTYAYDGNYNKVKETDTLNHDTSFSYDLRGNLVKETDALNHSILYEVDPQGRVIKETDRNGYAAINTYDPETGFLLQTEDALHRVTSYTYDKNGKLLTTTFPDGTSTELSYDSAGRVVSLKSQSGLVTEMTYDAKGNILTVSDDPERVYAFTYDKCDRLLSTTDPLGNTTSYEYDKNGNLTKTIGPDNAETSYERDPAGRVITLTDALNKAEYYSYDKAGNVTAHKDRRGYITEYAYDILGELTGIKDPLGAVTSLSYDGLGNLAETKDALGGITKNSWNALGKLSSVTDANGNTETYTYDANENVVKVEYEEGRSILLTYDAVGNLIKAVDEAGLITEYTVDDMDRVTEEKDSAGNHFTCTYDAAGNLIEKKDVIGRTAVFTYDSFGRLTEETAFNGDRTSYEYDLLDRVVKETLNDGTFYTYEYDENGNVTKETQPGGAVYIYTYDILGRLEKVTDPLGHETSVTYDEEGNVTGTLDALSHVTAYTYDGAGNLVTVTDARGNAVSYTYDLLGRLVKEKTAEGGETSYGYDALGNVTGITSPVGLVTSYSYDPFGNVTKVTGANGAATSYTYDGHNELTKVTDAYGNETGYSVNLNRLITKETKPNGAETLYDYDPVGRLISLRQNTGYQLYFGYGKGEDVLTQSDNQGHTEKYTYDAAHRMLSAKDSAGNVSTRAYDERGNLISETAKNGARNRYGYDLMDNLLWSEDAKGRRTDYTYDANSQVTSVTAPGERTTGITYDRNGNIASVTDPNGNTYTLGYDRDNRKVSETDPLGFITGFGYDAAGRNTSVTDRTGKTTTYGYDAGGNVSSVTDAKGNTTTYLYDLAGRIAKVTLPGGEETSFLYDAIGSVTRMTDALGHSTTYTYDLAANLTGLIDPLGRTEANVFSEEGDLTGHRTASGDSVRYTYDILGNVIAKTYESPEDPDPSVIGEGADYAPVSYTYDAVGNRTSMTDELGTTRYTYDVTGSLTSVTDFQGDRIGYTYDEADRVKRITYPDGTSAEYEYDKNGNLTKVTDVEGKKTKYAYDALDRVILKELPNNVSVSYSYDAEGRVIRIATRNAATGGFLSLYTYEYDADGFITREKATEYVTPENEGNSITDLALRGNKGFILPFGWGTITAQEFKSLLPEGSTALSVTKNTRFSYDGNGRLTGAVESGWKREGIEYTFAYDANGNRTLYEKRQGGIITEKQNAEYNAANQLTKLTEYTYAGKTNVLNGDYTVTIAGTPVTKEYTYTYDADGNLVTEESYNGTVREVEKLYTYEAEDRLKAVYDPKGLVEAFTYDGDGNRVFELGYDTNLRNNLPGRNTDLTTTGYAEKLLTDLITDEEPSFYEITKYVNDVNRQYVEVLCERNGNGVLGTRYTYGNERISVTSTDTQNGYYLYDGRGSVTAITGLKAERIETYSYDPTGRVTMTPTGDMSVKATYNGEAYDPRTGDIYLRARYYNTHTGTFITEDTYLGKTAEPASLNRYVYCNSNAVNFTDPSGHMKVTVLNAISYLYNKGVLNDSQTSIFTIVLNGKNLFTAFHEVAQLNIAKYLHDSGRGAYLEHQINIADTNTGSVSCKEADVVTGGGQIWEVKPSTYMPKEYGGSTSLNKAAMAQIEQYSLASGMIPGEPINIDNIHIMDNYYMEITGDITGNGLEYYSFYRLDDNGEKVKVNNPAMASAIKEKENKVKAEVQTAIGIITAYALFEEVVPPMMEFLEEVWPYIQQIGFI